MTKKDVGKRVSVRVTASKTGHDDGVASSGAKKVAKGKPEITAKAKSTKVGKRAKVKVRVKVAALANPRGTVIVKHGKKKIKAKLAANRNGRITLRLPQLRKGTYKIKVAYKPTRSSKKYVKRTTLKKVALRVR